VATGNKRNSELAEQARGLFAERAARLLPQIAKTVHERLSSLASQTNVARESQVFRDATLAFQKSGGAWVNGTARAWKAAQVRTAPFQSSRFGESRKFELMGDDVVEDKILSSRLSLRMLDFVSWELNDLRLRIQNLEGVEELSPQDILRPELLAHHMVAQWSAVSLTREIWVLVQDTLQRTTGEAFLEIYHAANEFLVRQGVMVEIDLRPLVRLTPGGAVTKAEPMAFTSSGSGASSGMGSGPVSLKGAAGRAGVAEETRMQTATTPLARARMRAQGVMGHLRRLLTDRVSGFDDTRAQQPSAELNRVIQHAQRSDEETSAVGIGHPGEGADYVYGPAQVDQAIDALRERSAVFKKAAASQSEKATIEIVALMFQSILAEDRIPAVIRVWFARLQIPVLRVAIAEPEFFGSLQHPARRLIDRMGSCVLGFNVTVGGNAMEVEVKRAVEVIEQYPETGRKVFQIVYDEFEKFLSKFLSEQGSAARVVGVAQQVEQKETMAIQYTIEMRNMLKDMSVRDEIRDFLFKVWTEALAIASMKNGPQHADTLQFKRAAADLVWAASAKPSRTDRARVISTLPKLLQSLRQGMSLLGLTLPVQDQYIKVISDTLADAFASKTAAIPAERIEAMAARLSNLEDYLSDEDLGDLPLDTDSLVTMLGMDPAEISVITDGGSQPSDAMRAWVQELQLGSWFTLDHNGQISNVQFAWCSDRKQLHLFAAADGRNFLIQARRLAAYLQAGLLLPTEEESLTVRATREALAKIDANPERLLG
jgi:Protein of unknown function (DUF1631)